MTLIEQHGMCQVTLVQPLTINGKSRDWMAWSWWIGLTWTVCYCWNYKVKFMFHWKIKTKHDGLRNWKNHITISAQSHDQFSSINHCISMGSIKYKFLRKIICFPIGSMLKYFWWWQPTRISNWHALTKITFKMVQWIQITFVKYFSHRVGCQEHVLLLGAILDSYLTANKSKKLNIFLRGLKNISTM
jgi:hypothetical protein